MNTRSKHGDRTVKLQSTFSLPLLKWYSANKRTLPWRETKDPYAIFVSEVMLQQTQVKTVIPYYLRWMKKYPTPQKLAKAPIDDVLKSWEGLGYYRRARMLHAAAHMIVQDFKGQFPNTPEEIKKLPGVGQYTCGAISSIAFGLPEPILDGNVIRVFSRWFGIHDEVTKPEIKERLWGFARQVIPASKNGSGDSPNRHRETRNEKLETNIVGDFNQSMMELGALICTPQNPKCERCPIAKNCWAFKNNAQAELPRLGEKQKIVKQFEYAGLVQDSNRILLQQRTGGGRMESLWQFPSIVLSKKDKAWSSIWSKAFGEFQKAANFESLKYTVTHHRINLELFKLDGFTHSNNSQAQWIDLSKISSLPFTSAHKKLVQRILNS